MKEKTTRRRSSSRVAWESLEKWARLEIQDWLQELMVVLFQKARVLAQDGVAPSSRARGSLRSGAR